MHSNTGPSAISQLAPAWLLTGASSGIGWAIARQLAAQGEAVLAWGRKPEALARLQSTTPGVIATQALDLGDEAALREAVEALLESGQPLKGLIYCAGLQHDVNLDEASYSTQEMAAELRVNLWAPMALCQLLLPTLKAQGGARLVLVSSALAFAPKRRAAAYSASKAGLHAFCEALRAQLQGSGIELMELIPPLVDTPMTAGRSGRKIPPEAVATALSKALQARRLSTRLWVGPARALPFLLRLAPTRTRAFFLKASKEAPP